MDTKKRNQIRYNIHRQIRKQGYRLNARKKTIYVLYNNLELSSQVNRLRKEFNYAVQTEIEAHA